MFGRNSQVCRNYTTPHKTQMIDTTINLLATQLLTKHKRLTQQSTYWLTRQNAQISLALP